MCMCVRVRTCMCGIILEMRLVHCVDLSKLYLYVHGCVLYACGGTCVVNSLVLYSRGCACECQVCVREYACIPACVCLRSHQQQVLQLGALVLACEDFVRFLSG